VGKDELVQQKRKRLRLEDILKPQQGTLQPRVSNKPRAIQILGFKLGGAPNDTFMMMPTLPSCMPTAQQLHLDKESSRTVKDNSSYRYKSFVLTL